MGCGSSSPAHRPSDAMVPTDHHQYEATGAGSVIISRGNDTRPAIPFDMQATKGGSYVIGRKTSRDWEPGESIDRPATFETAQHYYLRLPDGRALKLSYSAMSEQGRTPRPPNKANQDSYACVVGLGNNPACAMFAVFDGHGPKGEDASNFCRLNLPDIAGE